MDSKKIRALMTITECSSITAAAEKLGYTQPGLTNMMNALEQELGLEQRDVPLIGLVTRLTAQKGLDRINCVLNDIMLMDVQMVVVGTGDKFFEDSFRDAQ